MKKFRHEQHTVESILAMLEPITESGCWVWEGETKWNRGYAWCVYKGKRVPVHRLVYELFKGPIPDGLQIDHLCRVRSCANPDHLEAVTGRENQIRGMSPTGINARKTHCPRGHEYRIRDVQRASGTRRDCLLCNAMQTKISYYRRKSQ